MFAENDRALGDGARMRWFVPGRIEVLGKHTDYAGGRSLLCAVERGFCVTAVPRDDDVMRVVDVGQSGGGDVSRQRGSGRRDAVADVSGDGRAARGAQFSARRDGVACAARISRSRAICRARRA